MTKRLIVVRPPQPYPCDYLKGCPDFEPLPPSRIVCRWWHVFDGCKIKRALNMKGEAYLLEIETDEEVKAE